MKNLVFILIVLISNINVHSSTKSKIYVQAKNSIDQKVNLKLNGGFIELLLDYTNGFMGIWAQEIRDRGFDDNSCNSWLCEWNKYGNNSELELISGGYNENGRYSIRIKSESNQEVWIEQNLHLSDKTEHDVYFYAKTDGNNSELIFTLFNDSNIEIFTKAINISNFEWTKYSFSIPIIENLNKCKFRISSFSKNPVELDEISLMPSNNYYGFRKEYIDQIKYWKPSVLRYPGGWFADSKFNDWKNCLLEIDKRISPNKLADKNYQRMDMSFLSIMKLCNDFNIIPHISVNYENGTPIEAAEWVEFANSDTNTVFGKKRANLGFKDPFNIEYWEVGNEQWGNPANYAIRYLEYYNEMKARSNKIKIIIDGNHWDSQSFTTLMKIVGEKCDIWGYHPMKGIPKSKKATDLEKYLSMVGNDFFEPNVIFAFKDSIATSKNPNMIQAVTEWWASNGVGESDWLLDTNNRNRSMETGLWNTCQMMIFYRNSSLLEFASRTIGIGLFGRDVNSNNQKILFPYPTLHGMAMLRNHIGEKVASSIAECGVYNVDNIEVWTPLTKWLEVLSTYDDDSLYIAVVNRHPSEGLTNEFIFNNSKLKNFTAKVYELSSDHYLDYNSADFPDKITPKEKLVYVDSSYVFPKHSLTILAIPINFTGIPNDDFEDKLNFYPNPSSNIINVNYLNSDDVILDYKVFDIYGNLITSNKINDNLFSIDISNLATGCYWIQFRTEKGVYSKSFLKIL